MMNTNTQNSVQSKTVVLIIVFVVAYIGMGILSTYLFDVLLATLLWTVAIILPIRQKRFSFYSVFLIISGILFLVSGIIDNAYNTIVDPLPALKQIEFSKIMRPQQVSHGLSGLGFGLLYVLLSLFGLRSNKLPKLSENKMPKVLLLILAILGVLFSISGIDSIIEGLNKL